MSPIKAIKVPDTFGAPIAAKVLRKNLWGTLDQRTQLPREAQLDETLLSSLERLERWELEDCVEGVKAQSRVIRDGL